LLGYSFSWRCNLAALGQCAPVYAIDLPGVGFSCRPIGLNRSFRGLAATVLAAADRLNLRKFDLLGTSHGGAVAMMLAAMAPERVQRLVLVAPVNPFSRQRLWLVRLLATAPGRAAYYCARPGLAFLIGFFLRRMYGDPHRIAPGTLAGYAAPTKVPGTHQHLLKLVHTWTADLDALEQELPRISHLPILLIWGDRDRAVPCGSAEKLRTHFQRAQLRIIPTAGHLPYEELPEEFNRIVCGFLRDSR
jgi:pimeloyl-ACP methyl ester carboxylesterase